MSNAIDQPAAGGAAPKPPVGGAGARRLLEALRRLREGPPLRGGVLSAYLDTSPGRVAGQAYLLAFRNGCKALRAALPAQERDRFEAAVARAERSLASGLVPGGLGLALFAAGAEEACIAVPLPTWPVEEVGWDATPRLEPLQALLDEYERLAVVLFDKERARIFTLFLGEIETSQSVEDEVPGKHRGGGWFALAETRAARHHEDHVLRHARRTVAYLMGLLRTHPFDRLLVGGPDEALALLRHQLPRPLRRRLAGTLALELFAPDAEVLSAALRQAAAIERREEVAMVDELMEAATTPQVVLGLGPTLAALAEERLYLLLLADNFAGQGGECPRCGRLVRGRERCPACDEATTPLADLREAVTRRALDEGARLEVVSGEAAARLMAVDGIGAWTRY